MSIIPVKAIHLLARKASEDARQYAYRVLSFCILEFVLLPRQKLNEITLAESLEVSRTPVHDTFFKLSRENFVELYPKRGAFVSTLDPDRVDQAAWTHIQLGKAAINTIYIRNPDPSRFFVLRYLNHQMEDMLLRRGGRGVLKESADYMHQLYILAGDMEFIWESVQKIDVDFRRVLYLSALNTTVSEGFIYELSALTDALSERSCDRACEIYTSLLSRIPLLARPVQQIHPDYFARKIS